MANGGRTVNTAIAGLGNLNILVGGDPDYQDLVIGNPNPENTLLDSQADIPVTQYILEKFEIPFRLNNIMGSKLPGIDIKHQDATTMLKLSLAAELLTTAPDGSTRAGTGGFAEVEIEGDGFVRFYIAGKEQASGLDIRYCIPTSQIVQPADLVVIRGYDPPPRRELRDSFDGLKNAEIYTYGDCATQSCDESTVGKYATVSYDDPQLDQNYLDDIVNSYELAAFETLLGYLVDVDLPDGTRTIPGLKVTFGDTTKEYISMSAQVMGASINYGNPIQTGGTAFGTLTQGVAGLGGAVSVGGGSFATAGTVSFSPISGLGGGTAGKTQIPVTVTQINPNGTCTTSVTTLVGSNITLQGDRFKRLNKFGILESDFIGVTDVVFAGSKVRRLITTPGSFISDAEISAIIGPVPELVSLQHGKNWTYTVDPNTDDVTVNLFSVIEDDFTEFICKLYSNPSSISSKPVYIKVYTSDNLVTPVETPTDMSSFICNIGDALGYMTTNGLLCVVVERKRPSIDIFDPRGTAETLANGFITLLPDPSYPLGVVHQGQEIPNYRRQYGVRYTPVVIVDEPAPIAYAATAPLSSIDGTRTLSAAGIIDQADGIVDSDPTTVQDLEDSEMSILQDNTSGSTIDISLPFCTAAECLDIAQNFLSLQNTEVQTHSVVMGPDSTPRLGDFFTLPNGEVGVINEINYSYSDSSQYLITATVGPEYVTVGSFNDSRYQLRTEDVTREGIITQDGGNGTEYIVRIEGFGEIPALLMVMDDVSVGDKVGVRIYNNPVERI